MEHDTAGISQVSSHEIHPQCDTQYKEWMWSCI